MTGSANGPSALNLPPYVVAKIDVWIAEQVAYYHLPSETVDFIRRHVSEVALAFSKLRPNADPKMFAKAIRDEIWRVAWEISESRAGREIAGGSIVWSSYQRESQERAQEDVRMVERSAGTRSSEVSQPVGDFPLPSQTVSYIYDAPDIPRAKDLGGYNFSWYRTSANRSVLNVQAIDWPEDVGGAYEIFMEEARARPYGSSAPPKVLEWDLTAGQLVDRRSILLPILIQGRKGGAMKIGVHQRKGTLMYEVQVEEPVSVTRPPNQDEILNRLWHGDNEPHRPIEVEGYRHRAELRPFPEMRPYQ